MALKVYLLPLGTDIHTLSAKPETRIDQLAKVLTEVPQQGAVYFADLVKELIERYGMSVEFWKSKVSRYIPGHGRQSHVKLSNFTKITDTHGFTSIVRVPTELRDAA